MTINGDNSLPLSTKDAILFVLKKTIFEISKEYRDTNVVCEDDLKSLKIIKDLTNIYKNLLFIYIDNLNFNDEKSLNSYEVKSLKNIIMNIVCNEFDSNDLFFNNLNTIDYFMNFINSVDSLTLYNKLNIIELFIKRFNKQDITIESLQCKIYTEVINELLNNYSTTNINKLMNYLFN